MTLLDLDCVALRRTDVVANITMLLTSAEGELGVC